MAGASPRFPLFDSLRAIAALSIFAFHAAFFLEYIQRGTLSPYLAHLNVGVAIFFAISGFLLYRPFAQARHDGNAPPPLVPYAVRRFLRIAPAYWVALPLIAIWLDLPVLDSLGEVLKYFGFLQVYDSNTLVGGVGHAWTLCVEVTFYAMLPLWALAMRRIPARSQRQFALTELGGLALLAAASIAWKLATVDVGADGIVVFSPEVATLPAFLDHFAAGMALAVASVALQGRDREPAAVRLIGRAPWVPWLAAGVAFVLLAQVGERVGSASEDVVRHELRALLGVGVLLPAIFATDAGGWVRRLLANRALLWVGLVSYSLYLWHPPILQRISEAGWQDTIGAGGAIAAALAISLAVAAASFYGIERWALRLGRRISGRRGDQPAGRSGEAEFATAGPPAA